MTIDLDALDVAALFAARGMFTSRQAWTAAGFQIVNRASTGKIMVATHPRVPGVLFKKYADDVDEAAQLTNFERRVEGARHLRAFLRTHALRHVVTPQKRVVEVPHHRHVLVAEALDILDEDQTKSAYGRIAADVLRDLCGVLFEFRGMDSNVKNLPFTRDGRIALVDTEHWDRSTRKAYLHQIGTYLTRGRRQLAASIFEHLEDVGELRDFDVDDEVTSPSSSSSSSSSSS